MFVLWCSQINIVKNDNFWIQNNQYCITIYDNVVLQEQYYFLFYHLNLSLIFVEMSSSGNNLITELDKKIKAISNEETIDVFSYTCKNSCHRNKECWNHIGSEKKTDEALKCVKDFKLHLLNSTFKSGRDHRNLHLMYDLFRMQNPTNRELFNFTIG